tara:strand:- start:223 stop:720 length:498 start_codon:yes stop_codon:yes gene_type:complete
MVCYINFKIDGRDLMINENNPDDIKMWKNNKHSKSRWNQLKIKIDTNGYKLITITLKQYRLHRINYFAHNPTWNIHDSSTDNSIDHEDRNKANNNIENLRVVTCQENQFNTNAKGYYWNKQRQKWHAQIMVNGKQKHLGLFVLEEDAKNARSKAKEKLHIIPNRK